MEGHSLNPGESAILDSADGSGVSIERWGTMPKTGKSAVDISTVPSGTRVTFLGYSSPDIDVIDPGDLLRGPAKKGERARVLITGGSQQGQTVWVNSDDLRRGPAPFRHQPSPPR
jgi:hypothetical protein